MVNKTFAQEIQFIFGANSLNSAFPQLDYPEIAFVGRSNSGKSSLINALFSRKGLARTSKTPGGTKQINFFQLKSIMVVVDLPGYGYAKCAKTLSKDWSQLILRYLLESKNLKRVLLLIDARRGITRLDLDFIKIADDFGLITQIILTKVDCLKENNMIEDLRVEMEVLAKQHSALYPEVLVTSSRTGVGIRELQLAVLRAISKHRVEDPSA